MDTKELVKIASYKYLNYEECMKLLGVYNF